MKIKIMELQACLSARHKVKGIRHKKGSRFMAQFQVGIDIRNKGVIEAFTFGR